jgi:hypothetical protein
MMIRHALALTVTICAFGVIGCNQGPVNYDKFEQRTIEANLSTLDSAAAIYHAQFAAGNIDAACMQAHAFLLTQEGVDTAVVSPDSIVWAYFTSGLLAGTGDVRRDTTGDSAGAAAWREPAVRVATGGETGSPLHCVLPHNIELPGTQQASDRIRYAFSVRFRWPDEAFTGTEVDLGLTAGLFSPGTGIVFWSGHGMLCDPELTGTWASGLVMGKTYTKQSMAQAAAHQFAGYFDPGPGLQRQVAVVRFVGDPRFYNVVLPGFVRAHGNFDDRESLPFNACKTIVYLSCCYSGYTSTGQPSALAQAFLDVGADLVCGYSWAVGDKWSSEKDWKFFAVISDSCFPEEAKRSMGDLTDPKPGRGGYHAAFKMWGDTLILPQTVFDAHLGLGEWVRSCPGWAAQMYGSQATKLYGGIRDADSTSENAMGTIFFPSTTPASYDLSTSEGAYISWADIASGRIYYAQAAFVGTGGMLTIDECTDSLVVGHFSATLGWWDAGKSPYADPPDDTFSLDDGILKYSGKIKHYGALDPHRLAAELRPSPR